ncbi:MAG: DsrE family protein [Hydrogenobacter sp.]|uniref:DsrE family protein n=1 Tax=Hydrogenobacter thermophilus TaxID=940 RepID=UPI0030FAAAA8
MRLIALILTTLLLFLPHTLKAHEESSHNQSHQKEVVIVVNLTHGRGISTEMALNFANISLGKGYETVVWINSEGVKLADAKAKEVQAVKMLKEFLSKGGKVYVCPICAKKLGVRELIKGAQWANPDIIFSLISQDRARVISF